MIIGFDITSLLFPGTGVANYTYNLVKNLLLIDKKNQYKLFFTSPRIFKKYDFIEEFRKLGAKVCRYPFPFKFLQIIWGNLNILPIEWFIGKIDLFVSSDFLRPPTSAKTITTVHDLVWKLYPEYHEDFIVTFHEKKMEKTIKYKDTVIADSESTKNDLIKLYPIIDKNKINVIYPGIAENLRPITDRFILEKYYSKFLLYVGAIDPRKNLETAIDAFAELIKDENYSDYKFFISGAAGWRKNDIDEKIKNTGLTGRVKLIGFIKDEDLPNWYSAAKLTLYLSSYEGFGLPPLESLACGTPVIAGNNSSMKETIDGKFLVDVKNKEAILEKMKFLLTNNTDIDSASISQRFNWQMSAKQFLKIIENDLQ